MQASFSVFCQDEDLSAINSVLYLWMFVLIPIEPSLVHLSMVLSSSLVHISSVQLPFLYRLAFNAGIMALEGCIGLK